MTSTFFFDESGHSGDLTGTGVSLDFRDQPFFVLACVGIPEGLDLSGEVEVLRSKYRIPSGELKSKSLQSKPAFVAAIFDLLQRHELPVFVEAADKKYQLGTYVVQWVLLSPALGFPEGWRAHFLRNTMAQFLYEEQSDHVLDRFVEACLNPSDDAVSRVFTGLLLLCGVSTLLPKNQSLLEGIHRATMVAESDYRELREQDVEAYKKFLPPPDTNRFGRPVWMLPNQTAFTNICARINAFRGGDLMNVKLVHDQQLEVANVLEASLRALEGIKNWKTKPFTPNADYVFNDMPALEFATSERELGIQLADIVAGTVMRFYRDLMRAPTTIHPEIQRVMSTVLRLHRSHRGWGVNLVGPDEFLQ